MWRKHQSSQATAATSRDILQVLWTDLGAEHIAVLVDADALGGARHRHRLLIRDQPQHLGVREPAEADTLFAARVIGVGGGIAGLGFGIADIDHLVRRHHDGRSAD
jgi:hypothetical protein